MSDSIDQLVSHLNCHFQNKKLLIQALTHKSYAYENKKETIEHNEKLEFLGDAVLGLILGEFLLEKFPLDKEGGLSKKRASLVNEETLAKVATQLHLADYFIMGKGEIRTGGQLKPRLLSSCYEAVIGAMYLDQGFSLTREMVRRHFEELVDNLDPDCDYAADYKTRLQEVLQKELKVMPTYQVISEEGPSHDKIFSVSIIAKNHEFAVGQGKSKKTAEQNAAQVAITKLEEDQSYLGRLK